MNLPFLARAITSSPGWSKLPRAVLVVRQGPAPALALLGYFDEAQETEIERLQWHIEHLLPRLRYISYTHAEQDCEALSQRLIDRFGRAELLRFQFRAVPRGGFFVLGMLAYMLDLRPAQLESSASADIPIVVVDDCAVSGVRFSDVLRNSQNEQVIFAHLYSHPELRKAIQEQEPRVQACVSAQDLADYAPVFYGDQYDAWKERWRQRPNAGYWIGQPDHVCFPWNEPDVVFWNPTTETAVSPWRLLPPELCLKNRGGVNSREAGVQFQAEGKGPLRPASRTLFGELEGVTIVANVETGQSFELAGVAADMWRAMIERGSLEGAADVTLKNYDVEIERLQADLRRFATELAERGLLEDQEPQIRKQANTTGAS